MTDQERMPAEGHAEVRIVARNPETARRVAEVLRRSFAATEQRSYPAGEDGTLLQLTVDTTHAAGHVRTWLSSSRYPDDDRPYADDA
ncbi:hypothetical protein [Streptomyces sp. GC420]|uniref:hypothetical protein n=1 Tax=Streptomyces sp. GC420 TaxID=2697568 RepID=UPI001414F107|nr:hypothetical protein [Streptomyces sp. GC420]NBM17657.1 hypothetical protein [Streptomyces sp. GC420]